LADPQTTQYLGYNIAAARKVRDSVVGLVFSGGQHTFVTDGKLGFTKIIHVPTRDDTTRVLDVLPLSAKLDASLLTTDEATQSVVVNHRTVFDIVRDGDLHFEPATGLLAEAGEGTTRFVRVADDKLGPPFEIATSTSPLAMYFADTSGSPDKVFLTDPALADGRVAMIVHDSRVLELRDADLGAKKIHASKSYEVAGIVAIDRVGHIFTKRGRGDVKLNGGDVHFAATTDVTAIVPSPDGKLVAFVSPETVALFAIDGTLRWRIKIGDRSLGWTHDGRLLAMSGGSETLDLETGESIDRHCGWGFGLSQKPVEDTSQSDLVCEH
jgi:hypothetical protein